MPDEISQSSQSNQISPNFGILKAIPGPTAAAPVARPSPLPQAPQAAPDSGDMGGSLKGLLSGLKNAFGSNPVATASGAIDQSMKATDPRILTNALLPGATGQPGQSTAQSPQQAAAGVLRPNQPQQQGQQAPQGLGNNSTLNMIKQFEGFDARPKWDVNAYRAGYGSDTTTLADGSVHKITPGMTVSREDAERDLARRTQQFQQTATKQVGADNWNKLPPNAQASLTSVAYNYGSLPKPVVKAVQSGDLQQIASSVKGLAGDNKGINADRRNKEADNIISPVEHTGQVGVNNINNATHAALASNGDVTKIASAYLGAGDHAHADVLQNFFKKTGVGINPQNTPWCAGFVSAVLKESGRPAMGVGARQYLGYGTPTANPTKGDIAVMKFGGADYHVGFVDHIEGDKAYVLGGNQRMEGSPKDANGNYVHSVNVKAYPISSVLGFRTPPSAGELKASGTPKTALNDAGGSVVPGYQHLPNASGNQSGSTQTPQATPPLQAQAGQATIGSNQAFLQQLQGLKGNPQST